MMDQNNKSTLTAYEYFRVIALTSDASLSPDTILCMWGSYIYLKEKCLEDDLYSASDRLNCPVVEKYIPYFNHQFILEHIGNLHSHFYHYYDCHDLLFTSRFDKAVYQSQSTDCWILPTEIVTTMNDLLKENRSHLLLPFSGLAFYPGDFSNYRDVTICEENPVLSDIFQIRRSLVETESYTCKQFAPNDLLTVDGLFDSVLAFPPITSLREKVEVNGKIYDNHILFLIENFNKMTTADAEMVLLVPSAVLTTPAYKKSREIMVENNWLDSIVYLPDKVMGSGISFAMLHLSKARLPNDELRFLDASLMFEKDQNNFIRLDHRWIHIALVEEKNEHIVKTTNYQVAKNNYSLLLNDYTETLIEDENHEVLNLKNCLTNTQHKAVFKGEKPVVQPKDLSGHPFSGTIDTKKLDLLPCKDTYMVTERSLLVSKIGGIKTGICDASEENPTYINHMVMAWAPSNDYSFDLDYLRWCVSNLKFGNSAMLFINPKTFSEKRISLPISVKEQHEVYIAEQDKWFKDVEKELNLTKFIESKCESVREDKEQTVRDIRLHLCNIKSIGRLIENSIMRKDEGYETYILEKVKQLTDQVNDLLSNKLNDK